jgi:prepilin-type processing-associated H-X9-DG protein
MEMVATGNVVQTFLVMSNELSTPKILHCPNDMAHIEANSFASLASSNISYFVGLDARETDPQALLSGDDHFEIGGVPVKSGLLEISTNTSIAWTSVRHKFAGNILLADGSVQSANNSILTNWFGHPGFATNRLAIP